MRKLRVSSNTWLKWTRSWMMASAPHRGSAPSRGSRRRRITPVMLTRMFSAGLAYTVGSNRMEQKFGLARIVRRRDKIDRDFRRIAVAEHMQRPWPAAAEQVHGRSAEAVEARRSEVQVDTLERRARGNIVNGQLLVARIGRIQALPIGGKLQSDRCGNPTVGRKQDGSGGLGVALNFPDLLGLMVREVEICARKSDGRGA